MKEGGEFEKIHNRIDTCSGRLHLRDLHDRGITGKGVSTAIIDQALLVEHEEYKDNLKMYEEIHWPVQNNEAQMHGPAVASIAVGKTVGVAPGADLYYIAEQHGDFVNNTFNWDFTWLAKSIDRIPEVNNTLPENTLLVPMDSRTTASPTGADDYVFSGTAAGAGPFPTSQASTPSHARSILK